MATGMAHDIGREGLSNVAHALRRSTALYVAMSISPPEATEEELLGTADRLAAWIRGSAQESAASGAGQQFMGSNPWEGR